MRKEIENIFLTVITVTMILFVTFCFQVWVAGYDSLFQYFNMM